MINFVLDHFVSALQMLAQESTIASQQADQMPHAIVSQGDMDRFTPTFRYILRLCGEMGLQTAIYRCGWIDIRVKRTIDPLTYLDLSTELRVLREAIDDDIRFERFFHYRSDRVRPYMQLGTEWAATLTAFPSAKTEIEEGLDCYGLEHNTACMFHMMRAAELGMRALARERKVAFPKHPLEWADWQNVIDGIEANAKAAHAGTSRGPARDAAQSFYIGAVSQLRALKETRNRVMHMRGSFDELDALRAINQVRDFMNGLSAKIGETTHRPIRQWP